MSYPTRPKPLWYLIHTRWLAWYQVQQATATLTPNVSRGTCMAFPAPQYPPITLARGVGLRWRHFLLGRRSHRPDLHNPIDLCQGALPLGHVFVEASTTRGHDEFWRNAVPDSCVPEKWYSFPLLIPQPDWDKCHFFSGLISHIWFLGLQGLIPLRDQSR